MFSLFSHNETIAFISHALDAYDLFLYSLLQPKHYLIRCKKEYSIKKSITTTYTWTHIEIFSLSKDDQDPQRPISMLHIHLTMM